MLSKDDIKKRLGEFAASLVTAGTTIGLGTGTTVYWLIKELGTRTRNGFAVKVVPTSEATRNIAEAEGIPVISLNEAAGPIVMTIDGADEADYGFQLIKGGGGALLQEKMVASASLKQVILIDDEKHVARLGKFPLPVEVIPAGWKPLVKKITETGAGEVSLRMKNGQPFVTDHGHYILDCHYNAIEDPAALNIALHLLPGVVETGLFIDMANTLIIGYSNGDIMREERN